MGKIIEEVIGLDEPGKVDFAGLKEARRQEWFRSYLGQIARELEGKRQQLLAADLVTEIGTKLALKLQGEIAGMARILDLLTEEDLSE